MNINFDVVNAILTRKRDDGSPVKVLDWRIDNNVKTNSNNYTTQISRLIIRYQSCEEKNSATKEEICFVKVPIKGPFYDLFASFDVYNNETILYTEVLPKLYNIDKEHFTPRLYYFDDKMSLVLKDLSHSGYKCADRVQKLDVEHCIYALRCLAKYHALSVKLERTVGLPESVKCNSFCSVEAVKNVNILIAQHMPSFIDCIPENLQEKYPILITCLKTLSAETLINARNDSSFSKFKVLNHGDFSTNNILFKYDKYGIVKKVKLVDFQFTSWNTPAEDLMYFFITCMKFDEYLKYSSLLLNIYLNTLNKVLRQLDCPTYNMQTLLNNMDILHPYALFVLSCFLPYLTCDLNDPIDTRNLLCERGNISIMESGNPFKQEHYKEIASKWFEHFAQKETSQIDKNHPSD